MDDLTALKSFGAERVKPDPTAKADARRALEARFELESGRPGPAPTPPPRKPIRRRKLRLAFAGMAAVIVAAVILLVSSGGDNAPKAFAVEAQAGGGVTIKIYSLEDTAGLEGALKEAGIRAQVNWLPAGETCRERDLQPGTARTSMGGRITGLEIGGPAPALTIGVMTPDQYRDLMRGYRQGGHSINEFGEKIPNVSFDPRSFGGGESLVITGSPEPFGGDPEGGSRSIVEVVKGSVPACEPVPAAAGSIGAIRMPPGSVGSNSGPAVPAGAVPAAGQFFYSKTSETQLEGWEDKGRSTGPDSPPRYFTPILLGPEGDALPAVVTTTKEVWTAPDGKTQVRETLDGVKFLSAADQRRWEAAGSPPPSAWDPAEAHVRRGSSGAPVKEFHSRSWRGRHAFGLAAKLHRLPTEPAALRAAVEGTPVGSPPSSIHSRNGSIASLTLLEIINELVAPAALRAAAVGALGELPGVSVTHDVVDAAGRRGDALSWTVDRGFGDRVIFDPQTSTPLAKAEMIFGSPSTDEYGVPAGTVFSEAAYLGSGIVDSTRETAAGPRAEGSTGEGPGS